MFSRFDGKRVNLTIKYSNKNSSKSLPLTIGITLLFYRGMTILLNACTSVHLQT